MPGRRTKHYQSAQTGREMDSHNNAVIWCVLLSLLGHANSVDRSYYIAAVERKWDYAPSGINKLTGVSLDDDE